MDTIKKAFVLAGGNDQIELIKGLRRRFPGIEIILIDMNPNVRAKDYADKMLVISTMDFNAVLNAAKEEKIDLIISACGDQPLRTMAFVSESLGLPSYLTYKQACELTDKVLMKQKMIEGNIPTAKCICFDSLESINSHGLQFPLVIKPSDNNGSKGIIKVHNDLELKNALSESCKYSGNGKFVLEEFKDGEEYSVEAFISNGKPKIIFVSKNIKIKGRNTFTICKNEYVPHISKKLESNILSVLRKIGVTFGIDNVPILIQMIVKDDEINVIEFSARTGGGSKLFFIREMSGVDVIDNLIDITVGKSPTIEPNFSDCHACIEYLYTLPGKFSKVIGIDNLLEADVISQAFYYKPLGSSINASQYSSDRPMGILIKGNSNNEIDKKIQMINDNLQILNDKDEDILLHELLS